MSFRVANSWIYLQVTRLISYLTANDTSIFRVWTIMDTPVCVGTTDECHFVSIAFHRVQHDGASSLPKPCSNDGSASSHAQLSAHNLGILIFPPVWGQITVWGKSLKTNVKLRSNQFPYLLVFEYMWRKTESKTNISLRCCQRYFVKQQYL